eukprot:CAMPEP_0197233226 /NCGR_PEP_ID=MMETSP1429-20130617/1356_1 /TAXON_ID=49237 /ORGANISM="Chaetoceros  sp., Strain UNC1202" /LENGTH=49 /DNA_ID=CAMNT_0042691441 /DNA_START=357 /DNA_END=506 /DNA_ORIENTATION=-
MGDTELDITLQEIQDDIGIAIITGGLGGLSLVTAETLVDGCRSRRAGGL